MRARYPIPFALMAALTFALGRPATATIYLVKPDGTGDFPTIAAAVAAAVDHDIIELDNGVFSGPGNYNVWITGKTLLIGSRSQVASSCVIDPGGVAGESRRAFIFANIDPSAPPYVTDLTFRHARADVAGQEGYGGAIYVEHAYFALENCIFEENAARRGGAIYIGEESFAQITECRFTANQADESGGAVMFAQTTGTGVLHTCTFAGNAASQGGAIACWNAGNPSILSSTFYANTATSGGAHLYLRWGAQPMVRRCILATGLQGGAVVCESGTEIPNISCTDIWGNAEGDWTGYIADMETTEGNLHADPLFCNAFADNLHLQPTSPCNTGTACETIGAWEVGCTAVARVCCVAEACYLLEEDDCAAIGGIFITDPLFPTCDPDPCPVGVEATTWGGLKRMFIESDRPK
jgi:hypothetical protein